MHHQLFPSLRRELHRAAQIALWALLCFGGPALRAQTVDVFTVGADPMTCDFDTLEDALGAFSIADIREIRLATDIVHTGISIWHGNKSLRLLGGYGSCDDDAPGLGYTTIEGDGAGAVFFFSFQVPDKTVEISQLIISGGSTGVYATGPVDVDVRSSIINDNHSDFYGGGVEVTGGASVDLRYVVVFQNTSTLGGGGIYCRGAEVHVLDGAISGNITSHPTQNRPGGGIFMDQGCDLEVRGNTLISSNETDGDGGAIAVHGGSSLLIVGSEPGPIQVQSNVADRFGGGIAVDDSTVRAYDAEIRLNEAGLGGGGLSQTFGTILLARSPGDTCHDPMRCSVIAENHANQGHAIYTSGTGAELELTNTWIEGNHPNTGTAGATVSIAGTTTRLRGVVASGNLGDQLFRVNSTTDLDVAYSTFTANEVSTLFTDDSGSSGGTVVDLRYLIVWEDAGVAIAAMTNGGSVLARESLVHELESFADPDPSLFIATPEFVDPATGDYHLDATSPAIDVHDGSLVTSTPSDIDGGYRGIDDPGIGNSAGEIYDLGADEVGFVSASSLFSDGFESGDTTQWQ